MRFEGRRATPAQVCWLDPATPRSFRPACPSGLSAMTILSELLYVSTVCKLLSSMHCAPLRGIISYRRIPTWVRPCSAVPCGAAARARRLRHAPNHQGKLVSSHGKTSALARREPMRWHNLDTSQPARVDALRGWFSSLLLARPGNGGPWPAMVVNCGSPLPVMDLLSLRIHPTVKRGGGGGPRLCPQPGEEKSGHQSRCARPEPLCVATVRHVARLSCR